MKKKWLY